MRAFPLSDCPAGSHCGSMAMRRGIKDRKKKICSAGNIWPGSSCAAKINKSVKVLVNSVRGGSYYKRCNSRVFSFPVRFETNRGEVCQRSAARPVPDPSLTRVAKDFILVRKREE